MRPLRQKIVIILLAVYWMTIVILTHIPIPGWVRQAGVSDKKMHFAAYFILAALLFLSARRPALRSRRPWLGLLIIAVYSAADELTQPYFNRGADIVDYAVNIIGAMAGILITGLIVRRKQKKT